MRLGRAAQANATRVVGHDHVQRSSAYNADQATGGGGGGGGTCAPCLFGRRQEPLTDSVDWTDGSFQMPSERHTTSRADRTTVGGSAVPAYSQVNSRSMERTMCGCCIYSPSRFKI